jgi:transposase
MEKDGSMEIKVGGEEIKSVAMDHHGLVASVCKDLGIAEKIDARISNQDARRVVSPGKAVVAMILNGLGFTNRRLYLTSQFFESKPIERLLDEPIAASDITDYTLGHTLDEVAQYGSSKLFGEVAFETAIEHKLLGTTNHLDTTSFTVYGEYDRLDPSMPDSKIVEITYGHSKEHRPDLKQVVLSLVVNGASAMPIFMEPLSGNNSDKTSFHETIKKINEFKKQINVEKNFKWVADAALYTKDKLLSIKDKWLTRVPETIKAAQEIVSKPAVEIDWEEQEGGYKIASFNSNYGDVEQRWLLVYSEQAYQREKKTLERKLEKQEDALKKAVWHLSNKIFDTEKEGKAAAKAILKKYKFYILNSKTVPVLKYPSPGKPKAGEEKVIVGYKVETNFSKNKAAIDTVLNKKGRYILATNDLDKENFTDAQMLSEYKGQQDVEGGFKFLKDPWFMVDSIFLKSPRRIEALMMIMTLCLMVYNVAQYKLRNALKEKNETLPNQLDKQVKNPTLRWIFQIMEGIGIVRFYRKGKKLSKEIITNLTNIRKKIIGLFGNTAIKMYGLAVT